MNSFFGNFGSSFLNMMSQPAQGAAGPNMLMQALGAAMRGEDPHQWIQEVARQHPQLRQFDLNNLQNGAQQVCQQNGVNMQDMINKIDSTLNPFLKK